MPAPEPSNPDSLTLGRLINRARTRSRENLLLHLNGLKEQGFEPILEPAPRNAEGDIVSAPDGLALPLRYDFAYQDHEGVFQTGSADSVTISLDEPLLASWENRLTLEIHLLCWDFMSLEVEDLPTPEFAGLRDWFLRWFDREDVNEPAESGLYSVVHFLSDPVCEDHLVRFIVDLGSAPMDAMADLFDTQVTMGAQKCYIGRPQPQ